MTITSQLRERRKTWTARSFSQGRSDELYVADRLQKKKKWKKQEQGGGGGGRGSLIERNNSTVYQTVWEKKKKGRRRREDLAALNARTDEEESVYRLDRWCILTFNVPGT